MLADVLAATRIGNTILCRSEVVAPWGMSFVPGPRVNFHIVGRGTCWLRPSLDATPIQLVQGDIVLLPHGAGHVLADQPTTPALPYRDVLARSLHGWEADGNTSHDVRSTVLLCGAYHFQEEDRHPLLALLPPVIHVPADDTQGTASLQGVLRILLREACERQPGAASAISNLVDVLFVLVVRTWLANQPALSAGWLGALRDPQVGKALSLIHEDPGRRWTVASLAQEVAMSRAALAKRFSVHVGQTPLAYITQWRMGVAARMLRESEHPVYAIANRVGYESETAFSKAFSRAYALAPSRYRKQHLGSSRDTSSTPSTERSSVFHADR